MSAEENPLIPQALRELVETRLAGLALANTVKILYACESGSRAWGFASPDSDFDVRFIYAHPLPWYVAVEERRDVIETDLEETPQGLLDLGGWDLRKVLRLARKSNPVVWEWLQSPFVYHALAEDAMFGLRQTLAPFFSPIAACHHYLGLCRGTLERALTGDAVGAKKYFYMLRPLLAALWIERHGAVPPMQFQLLLPLLEARPDLLDSIHELLEQKLRTDERVPIPRIPKLDDFLQAELARLRESAPRLPAASGDPARLDGLLRKLLGLKEDAWQA